MFPHPRRNGPAVSSMATLAASTSKAAKKAKPAKKSLDRGSAKRNIGKDLKAQFGTPEELARQLHPLVDRQFLRPLADSTAFKLYRVKRLYISYMTFVLRSRQAALDTLKKDAPLLSMTTIKAFVRHVATTGASRLGLGLTGWTLVTTRNFLHSFHSLRYFHQCVPATKSEKADLLNMVDHMAKVEKVIHTKGKAKRIVRETDLVEFLSAVWNPDIRFEHEYTRLQIMAMAALIYCLGFRWGCVIESSFYTGQKQFLNWGDIDLLIIDYNEECGLELMAFIKFNWMKGKRMDESDFVQQSIRSLPKDLMIIDSLLILEAMAIRDDVFVENILDIRAHPERARAQLKFPYQLTHKPGAENKPLFTQTSSRKAKARPDVTGTDMLDSEAESDSNHDTDDGSNEKPPVKRIRQVRTVVKPVAQEAEVSHPMSVSSMEHLFRKIAQALGWTGFSARSFRYGYVMNMMGRMHSSHLKYSLGHANQTDLAGSTYQAPDRNVDTTFLRYGLDTSDVTISNLHSSVAWERSEPSMEPNSVPLDFFKTNPQMIKLVAELQKARRKVETKFGSDVPFEKIADAHTDDPLVQDTFNAMTEVVDFFTAMTIKKNSVFYDNLMATKSSNADTSVFQSVVDDGSETSMDAQDILADAPPPETVTPSSIDDVFGSLTLLNEAHPLNAAIATPGRNNLRYFVLRQYIGLFQRDMIEQKGICAHCYTDISLPEEKRMKDYTDSYSIHVYSCRKKHMKDEHWCCSLCVTMIRHSPPKDNLVHTQEECQDITTELTSHRESCLEQFIESIRLSDDTLSGPWRLAVEGSMGNSRRSFNRYLCPICLFGSKDNARLRKAVDPMDDDPRFYSAMQVIDMYRHLIGHWNNMHSLGGIEYNEIFTCGFPECRDENLPPMKTGAMITHLNNAHDYDLVECSLDHGHSPECFTLPTSGFKTITDAKLCHELLHEPLPTTNLVEHRIKKVKETQVARIKKLVGTKARTDVGSSTSGTPADCPVPTKSSASSRSTTTSSFPIPVVAKRRQAAKSSITALVPPLPKGMPLGPPVAPIVSAPLATSSTIWSTPSSRSTAPSSLHGPVIAKQRQVAPSSVTSHAPSSPPKAISRKTPLDSSVVLSGRPASSRSKATTSLLNPITTKRSQVAPTPMPSRAPSSLGKVFPRNTPSDSPVKFTMRPSASSTKPSSISTTAFSVPAITAPMTNSLITPLNATTASHASPHSASSRPPRKKQKLLPSNSRTDSPPILDDSNPTPSSPHLPENRSPVAPPRPSSKFAAYLRAYRPL